MAEDLWLKRFSGTMERFLNGKVKCLCGEICTHTISKTDKNPNRIYVQCPYGKRRCGFWEWLDEIRMCRCKKGYCKLLTSHTTHNKDRSIYCCPLSKPGGSKGCGIWEWFDPPSKHEVGTSSKGKDVKEETGSSEKHDAVKEEATSSEKAKESKKVNVEELRSWLTMRGEVHNELVSSMLAKLKDLEIDG